MKKPLGLFCLLLLWYPPLEAQNNHEGLLNKLIETKYRTELYLITHCNNQNQKDSALAAVLPCNRCGCHAIAQSFVDLSGLLTM